MTGPSGSGRRRAAGCVRELTGHLGHVYSLEFHPDGKTLLSGDLLGSIKQWDLASGKPIGEFDAKALHTYDRGQQVDFGGVRGLAISPDGRFVAAGGLHKATNPLGAVHEPIVLVFDAKSRKLTRTLLTDGIPGGVIWRLRYLADGSFMGACGGTERGIPALLEDRAPTRIITGSPCPTPPATWTFTPTASGSRRPITTAPCESPAWPPGRVDRSISVRPGRRSTMRQPIRRPIAGNDPGTSRRSPDASPSRPGPSACSGWVWSISSR